MPLNTDLNSFLFLLDRPSFCKKKPCSNASEALKQLKGQHSSLLDSLSRKGFHQNLISIPHASTTDESDDNDFVQKSAPQDRYCAECDIQFSSSKTFQVMFLYNNNFYIFIFLIKGS